ncbi:stress transcription factor A [Seminavis robusta]|uniref:Stress transcription factor A n=1 Tax=Seminavis robusta TaxID=568900 RepID=A0A9N8DF99_9STRA|nr:stress transcription factor A [Seminavis robusta]|eukprot:Sro42_g025470.1 stress transcription factor A (489) ;mRNA; f:31601-33067
MSGLPPRNFSRDSQDNQQAQDSHRMNALRNASSQQLMAAMREQQSANSNSNANFLPNTSASASLPQMPGSRASAMASFQGQLDTSRSSLLARVAQAQHQQQQQSFLQLQQQQQAAAAAEQAQREEIEFNSLLRQKRQIDEMILNSALNTRRMSLDPGLSRHNASLYGNAAAAAGAGLFPGQAATGLPLSLSASAAAMMGGPRNASNNPIYDHSEMLTGKIRGLDADRTMASMWQSSARRLSDPSHQHNRLQAAALMSRNAGIANAAAASAARPMPSVEEGDAMEEEDDEAYFNDAGSDEVDRDFKRSQENFPLKLYRIIYEVVKSGRGDVISFFPHGRSFAVHKPKEFISEIMPKYFATGRMNTFLKQLNLYGFRRITEGRDKGGYFHAKFILGKRHLCKQIKRKKTDNKAAKAAKVVVESKEADREVSASSLSAEEYATSLSQQMARKKQAGGEDNTKSPPLSPTSSRHPKMRWKQQSSSQQEHHGR